MGPPLGLDSALADNAAGRGCTRVLARAVQFSQGLQEAVDLGQRQGAEVLLGDAVPSKDEGDLSVGSQSLLGSIRFFFASPSSA